MPTPAKAPCMIRVIVYDPNDPDTLIHNKVGDHEERYFRDWITSTEWWAMRNGKTVVKGSNIDAEFLDGQEL
jgi:hypothetical protein